MTISFSARSRRTFSFHSALNTNDRSFSHNNSPLTCRPPRAVFSLPTILYTSLDMPEARVRKTYANDDLLDDDLEGVTFEHCQFVGANMTGVQLVDVVFENCKLAGIDFRKCRAFPSIDMRFVDCVLDGCNFSDLVLKNQSFVGCDLRRCTFVRTDLSGADFSHSDLTESLFHACDLTRADFSRSRNYAIDPVGNKITKARFSLPEAVSLLRGFDIEIKDGLTD